jgi:Ca2+-binding RTX toxin-like protein
MPGDNVMLAGSGNDSVLAGFGSDIVLGEEGNDTLAGYGTSAVSTTGTGNLISADGADFLSGGPGEDLLRGGGGSDVLDGGSGADTLVGGVGVDMLTGGTGRDVFVFGRSLEPFATYFGLDTGVGPGNRDVIPDFRQGEDRLDVSAYENFFPDSNTLNAPIFLGTGAFTDSPLPQVRYQVEGDRTVVQVFAPLGGPLPGQPPGATVDAEIELDGVHHLKATDFILT